MYIQIDSLGARLSDTFFSIKGLGFHDMNTLIDALKIALNSSELSKEDRLVVDHLHTQFVQAFALPKPLQADHYQKLLAQKREMGISIHNNFIIDFMDGYYEWLPSEVNEAITALDSNPNIDGSTMDAVLESCKALGWSFDYDLDYNVFDLRPVNAAHYVQLVWDMMRYTRDCSVNTLLVVDKEHITPFEK